MGGILLTGTKIIHCRVKVKIVDGRMSAGDTRTSRSSTLKISPEKFIENLKVLARFKREVQAAPV